MLRGCVCTTTIVAFAPSALSADAAQFGTGDEAVAMVKRVQEKFKKMVPTPRSRQLQRRRGNFVIETYMSTCFNYDCVVQAHAARKELVRKSLIPASCSHALPRSHIHL